MKRKLLFFVMSSLCVTSSFAQTPDKYTVSGGVLGAVNYSKFRIGEDNSGINTKSKWGFAPGVFVTFPLGRALSLEAQAQYSRMGSEFESGTITNQELTYLSVPLFFKLHAGRFLAFNLGGQADFLLSAKNKTGPVESNNEDAFEHNSLGVLGGVEIFPHGRVTLFGKYVHGLKQIDENVSASPNSRFNQQIQAGAKFRLFGKRIPGTPPPPPIPVVVDRDGDGVLDTDDKCPDVAGSASLMGCPDRDGDGIADADDKCPDAAGTAKYQGCPIPDTDGDGVNDEMDKCISVAGLAKYEGCPIPDTDSDGVNDEVDKCPTRAGDAANQGCPVIAKEVIEKVNFAAKNIFFATGSYQLLAKSNKSLDGIVSLLQGDETLMIDIDGHTDAQGSEESNQVLSDNRAGAVKTYLVSKGIAETRLKSAGYGELKPVADNTSSAGRAKNRRTEMVVRNY